MIAPPSAPAAPPIAAPSTVCPFTACLPINAPAPAPSAPPASAPFSRPVSGPDAHPASRPVTSTTAPIRVRMSIPPSRSSPMNTVRRVEVAREKSLGKRGHSDFPHAVVWRSSRRSRGKSGCPLFLVSLVVVGGLLGALLLLLLLELADLPALLVDLALHRRRALLLLL